MSLTGWYIFIACATLAWYTADLVGAVKNGQLELEGDSSMVSRVGAMLFLGVIGNAAVWPLSIPFKVYVLLWGIRGAIKTRRADAACDDAKHQWLTSLRPRLQVPEDAELRRQFDAVSESLGEAFTSARPVDAHRVVAAQVFFAQGLSQLRHEFAERKLSGADDFAKHLMERIIAARGAQ